jgi:hypothetical protein
MHALAACFCHLGFGRYAEHALEGVEEENAYEAVGVSDMMLVSKQDVREWSTYMKEILSPYATLAMMGLSERNQKSFLRTVKGSGATSRQNVTI